MSNEFKERSSMFRKGILEKITAVKNNDPHCKAVYFDECDLDPNDIKTLAAAIEENTNLKQLGLMNCSLTPEQKCILLKSVLKNTSIKRIDIQEYTDDPKEVRDLIHKVLNHVNNNGEECNNDCYHL